MRQFRAILGDGDIQSIERTQQRLKPIHRTRDKLREIPQQIHQRLQERPQALDRAQIHAFGQFRECIAQFPGYRFQAIDQWPPIHSCQRRF